MEFAQRRRRLKRQPLAQKIIQEIKQALIREELRPGDKLPSEDQLCRKFSVSRISIREAIKMLSALGVVRVKHGDGTYICKDANCSQLDSMVFQLILKDRSPKELAELRKMLEIGILEIVMENVDAQDIKKMEGAIGNFERVCSKGITDPQMLSRYDLDFHLAFAEATHNPLIIEIAKTVYQLYVASFARILYEREAVRESSELHKTLLQGIKAKDIQKTREIVTFVSKRWRELSSKPTEK